MAAERRRAIVAAPHGTTTAVGEMEMNESFERLAGVLAAGHFLIEKA